MNLQVTEKKVDGVERLLQVEVPADMVRQAEEKAVRRYASSARLPGFRPGKAPPAMIRQRFAAAIRQEAVESLIQEAYKQVVGDTEVKLEILDPYKRPVSATADSHEVRNVLEVRIRESRSHSATLLFDPEHNLEERILNEQFAT